MQNINLNLCYNILQSESFFICITHLDACSYLIFKLMKSTERVHNVFNTIQWVGVQLL